MNPREKTSWGGVADWYHDLVSDDTSYQKTVILPNLLRMMDIKKGESVLDVGCGEGVMARAFTAAGASVSGCDISSELIRMAIKNSPPSSRFEVAKAEDLSVFNDSLFDKAVLILSLQNIEGAAKALSEIGNHVRQSGKLYIVLNHPCFRIPQFSSWEFDGMKVQYRRIEKYLSESRSEIVMHPGSMSSSKTISFHRPLQYYFKSFAKAGFAVSRIEEWNSDRKSESGPRAEAEDRARKEIPLFMALECFKI